MQFWEQKIFSPFFIAKLFGIKVPQLIQDAISPLKELLTDSGFVRYLIKKNIVTNSGTIIFN